MKNEEEGMNVGTTERNGSMLLKSHAVGVTQTLPDIT